MVCFRQYLLDIFRLFMLDSSRRLNFLTHFKCPSLHVDVDVDARMTCLLWSHPRLILVSEPRFDCPIFVLVTQAVEKKEVRQPFAWEIGEQVL
jgi:hypothetical protein